MAKKLNIRFLNEVVSSFLNLYGDNMNSIYYGRSFEHSNVENLSSSKVYKLTNTKELKKQGFLVVNVKKGYYDPEFWPESFFYEGYNFPLLLTNYSDPKLAQSNPGYEGTVWGECEWLWYVWDTNVSSGPTSLYQETQTFRPLIGGINLTNQTKFPQSRGTLGLVAVDNDDNTVVALSSNHVLNENIFVASDRSPIFEHTNEYNSDVSQKAGSSNISTFIGKVKKYIPIKEQVFNANIADVAVSTLKKQDSDGNDIIREGTQSYKQYNLDFDGDDQQWATTDEIDSMFILGDNNEISWTTTCYKSGIGSGAQGLSGSTKVIPAGVALQTQQSSQNQISNDFYWVSEGLYLVSSADTMTTPDICFFGEPGDSGSAIIAKFGNDYKVVGLLYGGNQDNYFYDGQDISSFNWDLYGTVDIEFNPTLLLNGFASRIDNIRDTLNLSPLTDDFLSNLQESNFSDTDNTEIVDLPYPFISDSFITFNDKKYWQVGIVEF